MTDYKDRELKNSGEIELTPEQRDILRLEFELGRKERELEDARKYIGELEDKLFDQSADVFVGNAVSRIKSNFAGKPNSLERIAVSQKDEQENSFLGILKDFFLFAYATYIFASAFLSRPKNYRTRKQY